MGTSLSVKHDGSWRTVNEPFVRADNNWKTVHNIWIKNGGTWQLAHKTAYAQYQLYVAGSEPGIQRSDSITIAESVRYLRIVLNASGAGAGGGNHTTGSWAEGHATCPLELYNFNFSHDYAAGGAGGPGGRVEAVLEVKAEETYSWTFGTEGGGGGATSMHLAHNVVYSVGHSTVGGAGGGAADIVFTGPNDTSITARGGSGGTGATLSVASTCTTSGFQGQNVSSSSATGASGANTITGSKIEVLANTTGGGAAGGSPVTNGTGGGGTRGTIEVYQYRASQI